MITQWCLFSIIVWMSGGKLRFSLSSTLKIPATVLYPESKKNRLRLVLTTFANTFWSMSTDPDLSQNDVWLAVTHHYESTFQRHRQHWIQKPEGGNTLNTIWSWTICTAYRRESSQYLFFPWVSEQKIGLILSNVHFKTNLCDHLPFAHLFPHYFVCFLWRNVVGKPE